MCEQCVFILLIPPCVLFISAPHISFLAPSSEFSRRLLEAHARARLLLQRQIAASYILQRALRQYLAHRHRIMTRIDTITRLHAARRVQAWWRRMRPRLRWLRAYRARCNIVHRRAVEEVRRTWLPAIAASRETR